MYVKKFEDRKKYLRNKRIKNAILSGVFFGGIIGIVFGILASIRSQTDGIIVFFVFGVTFGIVFSAFFYATDFQSTPREIYIKCRVKKGIFDYERDVAFNDGVVEDNVGNNINTLESVHKSALIIDFDPGQEEDADGYVLAECFNKDGFPCVRAGDIHANPSLFKIKIPKSEIEII